MWNNFYFLGKGALIGFAISLPIGPIALLIIRYALSYGKKYGIVASAGAATADVIYAALAGFGISVVATFLTNNNMYLHIAGGLFLVVFGLFTFFARENSESKQKINTRPATVYATAYASTFAITLANPLTLLSFVGVFAGLQTGIGSQGLYSSFWMTSGIFVGSLLEGALLAILSSEIAKKRKFSSRKWFNRISGVVLIFFGIWSFLSCCNSIKMS